MPAGTAVRPEKHSPPVRRSRPRKQGRTGSYLMVTLSLAGASAFLYYMTASQAPKPAPKQPPAPVSAVLVGDPKQSPLFPSTSLLPGSTVTRCLEVTYAAAERPQAVVMSAADISGPLAKYMSITVWQGQAPGPPSCTGFTGTQVYTGSLAGMHDKSITIPWRPAIRTSPVYRFEVSVRDDDAAQGLAAGATFRWSFITDEPSPAPPTNPGGASNPVALPTMTITAHPTPTPTTSAKTSHPPTTPASRTPSSSHPASLTIEHEAGTPSGGSSLFHRAVAALSRAGTAVVLLGKTVGGSPGFLLYILLAMVVFLLVQRRIDERDPKLAAAPVWADHHAHFARLEPDAAKAPSPPEDEP